MTPMRPEVAGGQFASAVKKLAMAVLVLSAVASAQTITSVSPSSGPVGTSVTIAGSGFGTTQGTSYVVIYGTTAQISSWSSTSIVAIVPSNIPVGTAAGVSVFVGGVRSNEASFTVTAGITSLSPTSGPVGTSVTITGTNFGATQGTSTVKFNGTAATPTSWSATSIVVPVPSGATTGNVVVTVSSLASNGVSFTVTPNITTLSPTSGPVGTSVTITGTSFGSTQGASTVKFNGTSATPTSWNATSIVVPVPSGATTGNVVVTVAGQASNGVAFTVTTSGPNISSISPSSGPVNTSATISGTGFGSTQGTSYVKIYGTTAQITSWSSTSIVAIVPSGIPLGTVAGVTVYVGAAASNEGNFTITPGITSLSPSTGPVGTSVTITGTNFGSTQGTSTVKFNGTTATPTSWSATSIVVPVPSGATTGNVIVTVSSLASNGVSFTVTTSGPSITSLSPTSGPVGTSVTITGTNFGSTQGTSTVTFNGTAATPTSWSATSIVVPVPSAATTGNVVVTVGGQASNGASFTVTPHISSLSPTSGPTGTSVTITGTTFGSSQGTSTVTFNGTAATPTSWSATSIVVPVPNGATTGNVVVTVNGQASNGVSFTVTIPAPSISSVSPTSGPVGTSVTITGANFGSTQGTSAVTFNGTTATPATWSATSIVVPVPSAATTGNIVVNVGGQASNGVSFTVTPHISGLSPTSGQVGTSVTITGTTFGSTPGTSTVKFNGTTATPTSWSATSIVAPVPSGATTGNVVVTVSGQASNGVPFTVSGPIPNITGISPNPAPASALVTINGSNFGSSGSVTFNGVAAGTVTWSPSSITAIVPNTTSGNVVVTSGGQASLGASFTVSFNSPGTTAVEFSYDPLGRVTQRYTCTPSNCGTGQGWLATENYNPAGLPISSTLYGISFQQTYDAAGRVTQLTSGWVDAQHPATLATIDPSAGYGAAGEIKKMTLGNGLVVTSVLNNRLQPCRLNLNTAGTVLATCVDAVPTGNFQDFNYSYNAGSDNGKVGSFAATGQQAFNRSYSYDNLNRLSTMAAPGDACSGLSWNYDPWGNRTAQNATGGTCGQPQTPADNHNRLVTSPYQYDAAGNMTADGNHTYYYDAENRLIQVDGVLGDCANNPSRPSACYVYDAMGNRVEKNTGGYRGDYLYDVDGHTAAVVGNNSLERMYLYMGGSLLAEYFESTTYFVHQDSLGSTRLLSRLDQSVRESDDYYPFGESISVGTGSTLKFTGKERDSETGLDNFGARYDSSTLGRFMTPDWAARPTAVPYAVFGDPQSLNLYGYVRNDPVSQADADGHCGPGEAEGQGANANCNTGSNPGSPDNTAPAQNTPGNALRAAMSPVEESPRDMGGTDANFNHITYNISSGDISKVTRDDGDMLPHVDALGSGYSGKGAGLNNPSMENVSGAKGKADAGPIPEGSYTIGKQQLNITSTGTKLPASMRLTPAFGNQTHRSGFLIHGDNAAKNYSASEGCAIVNRATRDAIANTGYTILEVLP